MDGRDVGRHLLELLLSGRGREGRRSGAVGLASTTFTSNFVLENLHPSGEVFDTIAELDEEIDKDLIVGDVVFGTVEGNGGVVGEGVDSGSKGGGHGIDRVICAVNPMVIGVGREDRDMDRIGWGKAERDGLLRVQDGFRSGTGIRDVIEIIGVGPVVDGGEASSEGRGT